MWTHQQLVVRLALVLSSLFGTVAGAHAQAPVFDCNGNGIEDSVDIATGGSRDFNLNGIPDECESQTRGVAPDRTLACTSARIPARGQRSAARRWGLKRCVATPKRAALRRTAVARSKAPHVPRRP